MLVAAAKAVGDPAVSLSVVLSAIALVVAIASAISQVVLWRLSGPRVTVDWANGILPPLDGVWIIVTVTNSGRGPTTVSGWGFTCEPGTDRTMVVPELEKWQTRLPHRLEAHATVQWTVRSHELLAGWPHNTTGLRPFVDVAGDRKVSKRAISRQRLVTNTA